MEFVKKKTFDNGNGSANQQSVRDKGGVAAPRRGSNKREPTEAGSPPAAVITTDPSAAQEGPSPQQPPAHTSPIDPAAEPAQEAQDFW